MENFWENDILIVYFIYDFLKNVIVVFFSLFNNEHFWYTEIYVMYDE